MCTDQLLLNLVPNVLFAFQGDFGEYRSCATVLFADLVTGHGPQVDQAIVELLFNAFQIVLFYHKFLKSFHAIELLCNICPIETIDTVGAYDTLLE